MVWAFLGTQLYHGVQLEYHGRILEVEGALRVARYSVTTRKS